MEINYLIFVVLLLISNISTVLYFKKNQKPKKNQRSIDAARLLHDLTSDGEAVVRITVIDQDSFFLRSPTR